MTLGKFIWCIVGAASLFYTNLESMHLFDGVFLAIVDICFISWIIVTFRSVLFRRGGAGGHIDFDSDGGAGGCD